MRELPPAVRVVGHPLVASALTGLLVLGAVACLTAGPNGIVVALVLLIPGAFVARAAEAVKSDRDWKRAWDGMAPPGSAPRRNWRPLGWVIVAAVLGLYFWGGGQ